MASDPRLLGQSPRILIVRLSAIGDVIHGLPVLCALRERFPSGRLGWVVEDRAAALLRGHEALDELITLARGWLKAPRAVWWLRERLRAFWPDVTLLLAGLLQGRPDDLGDSDQLVELAFDTVVSRRELGSRDQQ